MRRLKIIGLTVITFCVLCAVSTAMALGAELPEFSGQTGFTGSSEKVTFETTGGTKIKCAKSTTTGSATSKRSGTFHLTYEGCEEPALKVKCNSVGDAAGVMLLGGEWHLVPGGKETVLMLLGVSPEASVECAKLASIKIKGNLPPGFTPINSLTTKYKLSFKQTKGKQEPTEYEGDSGEKIKTALLTSLNGGAFTETGVEATEAKVTTEKEVEVAPAPPVAPRVEQVDFDENVTVLVDHEKNAFPEKRKDIEEVGGGDKIEWKSPKAGEVTKNWPVDYPGGKKIKLKAVNFAITEATELFLLKKIEGATTITGTLTVGGSTLTFTTELTVEAIKKQLELHKTFISTGVVESSVVLPSKVRLYEGATIAWKWTVKEIGRAAAYEQSLGSSSHNIYTTFLSSLKQVKVFLTLLDNETTAIEEGGVEAPNEAQTIAGVWKAFSKLLEELPHTVIVIYNGATGLITRGGGLSIKYYYEITLEQTLEELEPLPFTCNVTATEGLLETGEGQCHSWAEAFAFAIGSEGIKSNVLEIGAQFGEVGTPCAKISTCLILVEKWLFPKLEGKLEAFPFSPKLITDETGEIGQSVKNPPSWFSRHFIVEVGAGANRGVYDPSYGSAPLKGEAEKTLKEYQAANISGFCLPEKGKCQTAPEALQLGEKPFEEFTE